MSALNRKQHWEQIYQTKELKDVSWYQPIPETSLGFFREFHVPLNAKIIDIGGGDSLLVDNLLDLGYTDITVLDISEAALEHAQQRLGSRSDQVTWIVADVVSFQPEEQYDFWHDRAAFHFLTEEQDIQSYLELVHQSLRPSGILVIGTFSESGPRKCRGIDIRQYSEADMAERLSRYFKHIRCITVDHHTPFETIQNFVFCSFRKPAPAAAGTGETFMMAGHYKKNHPGELR